MPAGTYSIDRVADSILHLLIGKAGPEESLDREVRWSLQGAQLLLYHETNPHAFRETYSITTTAGDDTYPLPDDFHQIIDDTVRFQDSDFRTLREIPAQLFGSDASSGDPTSYRILNKGKGDGVWSIFFHETPDTDTRVILLDYRALPAPVWKSTRGTEETFDRRWSEKDIHIIEAGAICSGKWTRYLNGVDLTVHAKTWAEGIATGKKNNNPVVGKAYQRQPYTGRGMRIPGGVQSAWWGGVIDGPCASTDP